MCGISTGERFYLQMSSSEVAQAASLSDAHSPHVINDFSIHVAPSTAPEANRESGSDAVHLPDGRSGLRQKPFPFQHCGSATWFTIRANKRGYIGRKKEIDLLVAMNPETAEEDVMTLEPGAAVVYDEPLKLNNLRSDLTFYPVPFDGLGETRLP